MLKNHSNLSLFFAVIVLFGFLSSCKDTPPDIIIKKEEPINNSDTFMLKVSSEMPELRIPLDNPFTKAGVSLGKFLFFDPILSGNNKQACADCHSQGDAFTDNKKAFSEGIRAKLGNRNSMPIFNLMWVDNLFWDGRAKTLRELATMPIENPLEMDARIPDVLVKLNESALYKDKFKKAFGVDTITKLELSKALEQFLLTIVSDNSKFDRVNMGLERFTASEQAGFDDMKIKGCFACHKGTILHDNSFHNIGLDLVFVDNGLANFTKKSTDNGKFKTPSLRNVAQSAPYMHDGRFTTLLEVIDFYDNDIKSNSPNISSTEMNVIIRNKLSAEQKKNVITFLNTLSDDKYLNNPDYKTPF
jgi:cytochrome c peroxidase